MGFLDDLIQTIQEAAAEARGEPPPKRPASAPAWQLPPPMPVAAGAQRQRQRAEPLPAAIAPKPPSTPIESPTNAPARTVPPTHAASAVVGDAARYRRLLHDPVYRRDVIVLKEILDRPLSLRRRR